MNTKKLSDLNSLLNQIPCYGKARKKSRAGHLSVYTEADWDEMCESNRDLDFGSGMRTFAYMHDRLP